MAAASRSAELEGLKCIAERARTNRRRHQADRGDTTSRTGARQTSRVTRESSGQVRNPIHDSSPESDEERQPTASQQLGSRPDSPLRRGRAARRRRQAAATRAQPPVELVLDELRSTRLTSRLGAQLAVNSQRSRAAQPAGLCALSITHALRGVCFMISQGNQRLAAQDNHDRRWARSCKTWAPAVARGAL